MGKICKVLHVWLWIAFSGELRRIKQRCNVEDLVFIRLQTLTKGYGYLYVRGRTYFIRPLVDTYIELTDTINCIARS